MSRNRERRLGVCAHPLYSACELFHVRNREVAGAFDDLRRSTALNRLVDMRRLGVVTDEDLLAFSEETRAAVLRVAGIIDLPNNG